MQPAQVVRCPECEDEGISRREFIRTAAGAVALTAAAAMAPESAIAQRRGPIKAGSAESLVKTLYGTLTPKQKELLKEFEKAGKTSPESEGFFSKVKEMFGGDD